MLVSRLLILLLAARLATATELSPDTVGAIVRVGVGDVRLHDGLDSANEIDVAYRLAPVTHWRIAPEIGMTAAKGGARYYYLDGQRDFPINERWLLTPGFGFGFFQDGRDLQLGHGLQFRSELVFSRRWRSGWRLGLSFSHVSNAGLGDVNPGTEELIVSLARELRR